MYTLISEMIIYYHTQIIQNLKDCNNDQKRKLLEILIIFYDYSWKIEEQLNKILQKFLCWEKI